jgi:hypothetical protein
MFDIKSLDIERFSAEHPPMATKVPKARRREELDELDTQLDVWAQQIPNLDPLPKGSSNASRNWRRPSTAPSTRRSSRPGSIAAPSTS